MTSDYPAILDQLEWGAPVSLQPIGGGCIADAIKATFADGQSVFVKRFEGAHGMFQAEALGLEALAGTNTVAIPRVLAVSQNALVLEWVEPGTRRQDFFVCFGAALAQLHDHRGPACGFSSNNFIGGTPQLNTPVTGAWPTQDEASDGRDWPEFFLQRRLRFQAERAAERRGASLLTELLDKTEQAIRDRLAAAIEPPSLLHGDLWSGNYLVDNSGNAVLIDPAVYYGHREADLAMTRLFGGFSEAFYTAYEQVLPLQAGHAERLAVYQLYHLLNHFNLFGESYLGACVRILTDLARSKSES